MSFVIGNIKLYGLIGFTALVVLIGTMLVFSSKSKTVEGFHRTMTPHSAPTGVDGSISFCPAEGCAKGCAAPVAPDAPTCEEKLYKDGTGRCYRKCSYMCMDANSCTDNTCCSGCGGKMFPVDCQSGTFTPLSQQYMSFNGKEVNGGPSYPVGMLVPNVAQYGKRVQVIHPTTLMREELFPANYAAMHYSSSLLAANPEAPPQLEFDGMPIPPASHPCPTCKDPFPPDYKCRPSLTGMFTDCGPYGLNVGRYGNHLTGCNCPVHSHSPTV